MYFSRDGGEEALLMQFLFRIMYFSRDGGEEALLMQFLQQRTKDDDNLTLGG